MKVTFFLGGAGGFTLRALLFIGKHSTTWATKLLILPISTSRVDEMTSMFTMPGQSYDVFQFLTLFQCTLIGISILIFWKKKPRKDKNRV
jgi:hypothetical protein